MNKQNWTYKKVKEVCDKESSNIVLNKIENNTGDFPLYGASGFVKGINFYHREEPYIGIVKDGSGVGRVNVFPAKSSLVGTMQYILPKKDCSLKYLCYVLQGLKLDKFVTGAAIPHIYFRDYGECTIPVPPLSTQSRIVSELDLLQSLIDKQKAQLKEYDTLAQSIFYDMFGDPVENEKGWEVKEWGELFDTILGKMLDAKKQNSNDEIRRYLGNSNVQWRTFDLNNLKTMSFSIKEIEKLSLRKGDVLICEGGESGRCAVWEENNSDILFQKAIHRARVKTAIVEPHFIPFLMEILRKNNGLKNYVSQATIEHLTGEKLNKLSIILPPLSLQQTLATKIEALEKQKTAVGKSIAETQKLFDYTMDKNFG